MRRRNLMYTKEDAVGRFKIGENKYVTFSPGNLQYQASSSTWRFAGHQYDYIGNNPGNSSTRDKSLSDWIDLFGWGTSGYNNTIPYSRTTRSQAPFNTDIAGSNYDWGVFNNILNPLTEKLDPENTWRTLTKNEWNNLFEYNLTTICTITVNENTKKVRIITPISGGGGWKYECHKRNVVPRRMVRLGKVGVCCSSFCRYFAHAYRNI